MKTLIIAEKPSVATDIARVLGKGGQTLKKQTDYYENDDYVVASAVGHLLELSCPEKYEVKRGKWKMENLPVLPPAFDLKPIAKSAEKLKGLGKLLRRKDIDCVINACDAGREGELIFRYIMQATKSKKQIKRLWLQSMTEGSIREAFSHLRSDEEMQNLAQAAKSRSEADWLVGINGTRAMTAFNSLDGGFFLTTVGRVQTPTLAIVVNREDEIRSFVAEPYWTVAATFNVPNGTYVGKWFDPAFKKDLQRPQARADRLFDVNAAQEIVHRCQGQLATVSEECKREQRFSPPLFDLTSLQREANNKFGFSAKTTLSIAQSLYEKHKALTYPRTDSRALPEDYAGVAIDTLGMLAQDNQYSVCAGRVLNEKWVRPSKRIFDNSKISDHFAIIPTMQPPKSSMTEAERKIYDLVVKRFIAVFYPAAEFDVTVRISTLGQDHFRTEGKVLIKSGWLDVYGRGAEREDGLVALDGARQARFEDLTANEDQTRPPARYTEATLLSAMEGAGKLLDEEAFRDAMREKGLGTPATRASIIENLVDQNYLRREGRELCPTAKARELFTLVKGLGVQELLDPKLTGEWEWKLSKVESGELSREAFMQEIRTMTAEIVDSVRQYNGDTVPVKEPLKLASRCPKCGGSVVENYRRYACTAEGCDFSLPKHPAGRMFEPAELETLLQTGHVGPLQGFISKMGRPFEAELKIDQAGRLAFDFGDEAEADGEAQDISDLPVVGICPKCGGRVLAGEKTYFCENTMQDKRCDFRSGRTILSQEIDPEQMAKILSSGRSDLLPDFVSKRTNRKFKAYLKLNARTHAVEFEFEPREEKKPSKSKHQ